MTLDRETRRYGQSVVVAAWLAVFCLFGFQATLSMLRGPMSKDLGLTHGEATFAYSFMMVIYAMSAFLGGWMADRWGGKPAYTIAAVLGATGFFATSFVHSLPAYLFSFGVLVGIAMGMLWVSSTVSVRKWYVGKKYASMWGIAFAGAPISLLLFRLCVREPLAGAGDDAWRGAMQILAGVTLVALWVAASKAKEAPEAYGMKASGWMPAKSEADERQRTWSVREAFSTYPIWGAILIFLTSVFAELLIWTRVVSYWHSDVGMSLWRANNLFIAISVVGIFSIPVMGLVADRVVTAVKYEAKGRKIMLIVGPATGVLACLLLLAQTQTTAGPGLAACFIFAVYWAIVPGGVVGYSGAVYGQKTLGKIWGLATLIVMAVGPLLGPVAGECLEEASGGYTYSIVFALCAFAVSSLLACSLPLVAKGVEERAKPAVKFSEAAAHRPN